MRFETSQPSLTGSKWFRNLHLTRKPFVLLRAAKARTEDIRLLESFEHSSIHVINFWALCCLPRSGPLKCIGWTISRCVSIGKATLLFFLLLHRTRHFGNNLLEIFVLTSRQMPTELTGNKASLSRTCSPYTCSSLVVYYFFIFIFGEVCRWFLELSS